MIKNIIGSGLQAGRDPKRGVPSLIIVLIFIIIVVGFDIYYAKVIKNYIDSPENVTPQNFYIENPAQNGPNPPNHVTYVSKILFPILILIINVTISINFNLFTHFYKLIFKTINDYIRNNNECC